MLVLTSEKPHQSAAGKSDDRSPGAATMAAVVGGSHFHQAELTTMLARWNSCSHYSLGRWRGRLWAACRCGLRQRRAAWQRERPAKRALTPCDRSAADWSKACGFFEANPEATEEKALAMRLGCGCAAAGAESGDPFGRRFVLCVEAAYS